LVDQNDWFSKFTINTANFYINRRKFILK